MMKTENGAVRRQLSASVIGLAILVAAGLMTASAAGVFAAARQRDPGADRSDSPQAPRTIVTANPALEPFTKLATLGGPAPGGGTFAAGIDFEPYGLNSTGKAAFAADMSTGGEGVFLGRKGQLSQITRAGLAAPGGGTFGGFGVFGNLGVNDAGDAAFAFGLEPFSFPIGAGGGVYRYTGASGALSAVVVPGMTPAPTGGTFVGAAFRTVLNNMGEIAFAGIVETGAGIADPLGMGIFKAGVHGEITNVASPGDPTPGGGVFDFAQNPWINDPGDIAFGAHVAGEECIAFAPQNIVIFCGESVYVRSGATGAISSIAHQGAPAPGGGVYRLAFGPVINNRGEIVFIGDLTESPGVGDALAVFLFTGGQTIRIAAPGDPMPGGGTLVRAAFSPSNYFVNNRGDVVFNATLDNDANGDGIPDTGLYLWAGGALRLIARSGTVAPGIGTIAHLQPPVVVGDGYPHGGAILNDRGQVLFQATLDDGIGVLLMANAPPLRRPSVAVNP